MISSLPWGNQGATLPGVSVGWRVSREEFFKNINQNFISDLKVRASYAKVGNVEIGNYPYAGVYNAVTYGQRSAIQYGQIANPNLVFETSKKIDIGLDLSFLDNRIQFSADYFKNNIDNLILAAPIAPSLGVPFNNINVNVGEMYNQGYEFSLGGVIIQKGDFRWNANLNFTSVKNKVTRLANNNADIIDTYNITRVGNSIGTFFGFQARGVNPANGNPLWEKADGSIIQGTPSTGRYAVYDPKNPADASVTAVGPVAGDKRILGEANPTWYGGFNNTFAYKNFDLNISLSFAGGNKIYNVTRQDALLNQKFQNGGKELLKRWTKEGDITDVPRLFTGGTDFINRSGNTNSRFLENAAFLRAQNIGLGYNLPSSLLKTVKISSLRVFAQVQNAFVITSYTGLDPELSTYGAATGTSTITNANTNRQPGIDYNASPVPRTYTFGLNLGL
jgi:hypothetical protein